MDWVIAAEAERSNHAAEHHRYWLATGTKPCLNEALGKRRCSAAVQNLAA